MINGRILQEILRSLERDVRCPHCNASYSSENINLVSQVGDVFLLKLDCMSCGNPLLVNVFMQREGPNGEMKGSSVISSDLSPEEIRSGKFNSPITMDELIDIANDINKTGGGFSKILK